MEYFYTPPHLITPHALTVEGDEFNHLTHVMRKRQGDTIRVVNGTGTAYDVTIIEISKHVARCEVRNMYTRLNEPEVDVTIGVAVLKNGSRFDFLVEKVTELGVNAIVPLLTERTIPRHTKLERLQRLALAAMKQSGRCVQPEVKGLMDLTEFLQSVAPGKLSIIAHEQGESSTLAQIVREVEFRSAALCIGPEGGFTEAEVTLAEQKGFRRASLGSRRLRTETAAILTAGTVLGS